MRISDGLQKGVVLAQVLLASVMVWAQENRIVVQAVDGRNGKPIANSRLLIFSGETTEDVKQHRNHSDLVTDAGGLATLTFSSAEVKWIQIFVDGSVLCQTEPNSKSFSVGEIMSTGLKTPNTCNSLATEAAPGHFLVFARPAHFMEKMRQ